MTLSERVWAAIEWWSPIENNGGIASLNGGRILPPAGLFRVWSVGWTVLWHVSNQDNELQNVTKGTWRIVDIRGKSNIRISAEQSDTPVTFHPRKADCCVCCLETSRGGLHYFFSKDVDKRLWERCLVPQPLISACFIAAWCFWLFLHFVHVQWNMLESEVEKTKARDWDLCFSFQNRSGIDPLQKQFSACIGPKRQIEGFTHNIHSDATVKAHAWFRRVITGSFQSCLLDFVKANLISSRT